MNGRVLGAFLLVVASSGCIINGGGGGGFRRGNISIAWTFAGQRCADVPQVKSVVVSIPGQTLDNGGVYPCNAAGADGIQLLDFAGGNYTYTLSAVGYSNEQLYTASGSMTVNGNITLNADLTPVGGATSYAYLTWSFPPYNGVNNPNCAQVGITSVRVSIDGAAPTTLDCNAGFGTTPGVQTPFIAAGAHNIDLSAVDSTGYEYYGTATTLTTFAGNPVSAAYQLPWSVGGVAVSWTLKTLTGVPTTCAGAGVTNVIINFVDAQGVQVYGTNGDVKPCGVPGVAYPYLRPGSYRVQITAYGSGTDVYQASMTSPVTVTAVAGQFVDVGGAGSVNVSVPRVQ